jgi:hypothetical protein
MTATAVAIRGADRRHVAFIASLSFLKLHHVRIAPQTRASNNFSAQISGNPLMPRILRRIGLPEAVHAVAGAWGDNLPPRGSERRLASGYAWMSRRKRVLLDREVSLDA